METISKIRRVASPVFGILLSIFFIMLNVRCNKEAQKEPDKNASDSLTLINNQKATIEGVQTYSGKQIYFGLVYQPSNGLFMISGGVQPGPSQFPAFGTDFSMTHEMKAGDIISLVERNFTNLNGRARYMEGLGYENDFWTENSVYSGKLTITKFDKERRVFSADFEFKAVSRTQYGNYLGERSIKGSLQNVFCIDATDGHW